MDAQHDLCLSYSNMQIVGSLTARPIKNYYVFELQQLSGHIISKYNNNNNNDNYKNNNNKKYMHSNYSDQSVQSDERSQIT